MSRHWDEEISIPSLLSLEPSPPPTSLAFVRTGLHGRVTGYTEANILCPSFTQLR